MKRLTKKMWIIAAALSAFGVATPALAQLDFSLNLGGPGYDIGFSNVPQYTYLAPPSYYEPYYTPTLYSQYVMWQYYLFSPR